MLNVEADVYSLMKLCIINCW